MECMILAHSYLLPGMKINVSTLFCLVKSKCVQYHVVAVKSPYYMQLSSEMGKDFRFHAKININIKDQEGYLVGIDHWPF